MEPAVVGGDSGASTEMPHSFVSTSLRRVLIVGGGLAGLAAARELRCRFRVTVVDAKEYFEFPSSIMRAYASPSHWDAITFLYKDVLEMTFGVGFIWGEVTSIDGGAKCARIKAMFTRNEEVVPFDYCIVSGGCNFNSLKKDGESWWRPTVHQKFIEESEFRYLDERFLDGRRRRILEEHRDLVRLNDKHGSVLVDGANFMGVEWACELQQNFPNLVITIAAGLEARCLIPLPMDAATYCEAYMTSVGIRVVLNGSTLEGADKTYKVPQVKPSSYFMPPGTLSDDGWILTNRHLQVLTKEGREFGDECIFAVGDCICGRIDDEDFKIQPLPKTGYTGETQALQACTNLAVLDRKKYGGSAYFCCLPLPGNCGRQSLASISWPWGSGIWAISLGSDDGCLVVGGNYEHSLSAGKMLISGQLAAAQKELIESTKVAHCRGDHILSSLLWYLIHHWPINCVGCCIRFPIPDRASDRA